MTKRTLLLGVGAQRAGTTWLHRYLSSHPQVNTGIIKEYHLFDALYCPEFSRFRQFAAQRVQETMEWLQQGQGDAQELKARLVRDKALLYFYENPKYYFAFMNNLFEQDEQISVVTDITPSYAALRKQHFTEIDAMAQQAGLEVKIVFIMRDPVDRIFSSARKYETVFPEYSNSGMNPEEIFLDVLKHRDVELRSRYEETIVALESVFPDERVGYFLYERLFTEDSIARLCSFLEIEYIPAELKNIVNKAEYGGELSDPAASQARQYYSQTYDYCSGRFGEDVIKALWKWA